jgi:hypothetical protein
MKVDALQTANVKVELDKETVDLIVRTRLLGLIGLESYAKTESHRHGIQIKDGYVESWWEEGGGSHSWFEDKRIRKATDLDIRVFAILDDLKKKK